MTYYKTNIIQRAEKLGVETDINKRLECGTVHHPKSIALFDVIEDMDFNLCGDFFCWKRGGDGDNGEILMCELDIYFEVMDKEISR